MKQAWTINNQYAMNTIKHRSEAYSGMVDTITSRVEGMRKTVIKESLGIFPNVAHRLEEVATIRGIRFINDSKATNINAVWYALETMRKPVLWITGGQDDDTNYRVVRHLVQQKVKAIICIGADNTYIGSTFKDAHQPVYEATDMRMAVETAYELGVAGDVVLLSPGCPSFDRFENYADRGNRFVEAVLDL